LGPRARLASGGAGFHALKLPAREGRHTSPPATRAPADPSEADPSGRARADLRRGPPFDRAANRSRESLDRAHMAGRAARADTPSRKEENEVSEACGKVVWG